MKGDPKKKQRSITTRRVGMWSRTLCFTQRGRWPDIVPRRTWTGVQTVVETELK